MTIRKNLEYIREDIGFVVQDMKDIAFKLSNNRSDAKNKLKLIVAKKTEEVGAKFVEASKHLKEIAKNTSDTVEKHVNNKPFQALILAMAVGVALGMLVKRNRNVKY